MKILIARMVYNYDSYGNYKLIDGVSSKNLDIIG